MPEWRKIFVPVLATSGLQQKGLEVVLPPLFPYFIAGLSFLTGNAEFAGRLLSVMMGSLLVVPVYLIGVRI